MCVLFLTASGDLLRCGEAAGAVHKENFLAVSLDEQEAPPKTSPEGSSSIFKLPIEKGRLYWQTRAFGLIFLFASSKRIVSSVEITRGTEAFLNLFARR